MFIYHTVLLKTLSISLIRPELSMWFNAKNSTEMMIFKDPEATVSLKQFQSKFYRFFIGFW